MVVDVGPDVDVDVGSDKDTDVDERNKLPGQEVMQKHASFPGVGTHSVVRGRTPSPHRQQNRESGEVQHGAHVHE